MSNEVRDLCRQEVSHRQDPLRLGGLRRQRACGFGEFDRREESTQLGKRRHELPMS